MNKKQKWYVLLTLLFTVIFLFTGKDVSADARYYLSGHTLWAGNSASVTSPYGNFPENIKIISVKSSKPRIIKITKNENPTKINDYQMIPLKAGKSTISVKFKTGKKTYTASGVYTVKKYPNPFEYIKLNGQKIDLKKFQYSYSPEAYAKSKAKISVKLKKGWKFEKWEKIDFATGAYTSPKTMNGKSFKLGKDGTHVGFRIVNSAGDSLYYYLVVQRR